MVVLKTSLEIATIRRASQVVAKVLFELEDRIRPGVTTREIDRLAEKIIRSEGATPAFKGYRGFPSTLCISPNDVVVHGIPGDRPFEEGDIVGVDCGAIVDGFYGDSARTFAVGQVDAAARRLMETTEAALYKGIDQMRPGNRLFDISAAIQAHAESAGFSVVRDFVGHGVGRALHEDPQVPNYGQSGKGMALRAGMVLALEPMVNIGGHEVKLDPDGWTARTADGSLSAHYEHTVAITEDGPEILSDRSGLRKVA